ncbi:MAG: molybdate ABC transporter substrate-binding protein [Campylobacter sp.]|nr:molybdate ABC transporter substrate-binding protein [Campylobacter sp.]
MRKFLLVFVLILLTAVSSNAENIRIASGAGYKNVVMELVENFEYKDNVESIFANIKQISTQAKNSDIALVVGDEKFLNGENLGAVSIRNLGVGKLVLIYPKDRNLTKLKDLEMDEFKRISIPDIENAIYGIAAKEVIHSANLKIYDKLLMVSTVPQASSYIVTSEVDAGFVNLTAALNLEDKIGGYLVVDEDFYSPIKISVYEMSYCQNSKVCQAFLEFIQTDKARKIIQKHGL